MIKHILAASLLWAAGLSAALAIDLDTAKAQGLLGETPEGYLAAVIPNPGTELLVLMKDINAKRREVYEGIAKKNAADVRSVEVIAGAKAIQKTPPGQFVYLDKKWVKK